MDTFAGYIARDGGVFVLPANLVDLIYINDAGLGAFDVAAGVLDQTQNDIFNVFTNITGFGERRCIDNRKRHAQQARQRLREQRFARAGWSNE